MKSLKLVWAAESSAKQTSFHENIGKTRKSMEKTMFPAEAERYGVVFFIHGREWCSSPCIMAAVITPPHPQKSWLITRIERLVQCVPSGCPTAASLKDHIAQKKYTDISLCVYCCCIDRVRDCPCFHP